MSIKNLFITLIILLLTYFMLKTFIFIPKTLSEVEYSLNGEQLKVFEKKQKDYIYYEISDGKETFAFKTDKAKGNYLIKEIIYEKIDDYTCIYPIFKNSLTIDILCNKNKITYPYQTIKGKYKNIDNFKENIETYEDIKTDIGENIKKDSITIYKDNIKSNAYIALESYKGLYLINKKDILKEIELFDKDIYKKELSTFYKNKYVVADYNKNYTFHEYYILDIKTGKKTTIANDEEMNFDSYIMGVVENKTYVFDKNNKEQYTINLKNNTLNKVGNTKSGINYYVNGKLKTISSYDALNDKKTFNEYKIENEELNYYRVDLVNEDYYIYEKDGDFYNVYKVPKENKNLKTYLFKTTDIEDIVYVENDIYFIYQNQINYYNEKTGLKTIIKNKELEYNKALKFNVYYS